MKPWKVFFKYDNKHYLLYVNQENGKRVTQELKRRYHRIFVFQLTKVGLVTSIFEEEVELYKNRKALYLKLIRDKEIYIIKLRGKLNKLECCSPDELRNL